MDKILISLKKYFDKEKITTFIITFITMMFAHFELYSLIITGPDTLFGSIYYNSWQYDAGLGRFSLFYSQIIKGFIVSPFLSTLLCAVMLSFAVILIIDIFKIKNKYFKYILGIIIAVCPNISATLTFFFCSDGYIAGMLLAVTAVFVVTKFEKNKFMPILGGFIMAISMGMYQTYLSVTMVLFSALILIDLLKKEDTKLIFKRLFKYIITGIIGIVLYYIFMNLALLIRDAKMSSYSGANEINFIYSLTNLPILLPEAYKSFFNYYFTDNIVPSSVWHSNLIYFFLYSILTLSIGIIIKENKLYKRIIFILLILAILPICFGIIELITPNINIHVLMGCSFILFFPILFAIIELINQKDVAKIIKVFVAICSLAIIWIYIWQDNASYIWMNKTNTQMKSVMNRIVTRVEELEEFNKDMPILVVGQLEYNEYLIASNQIKDRTWGFISCIPMIWKNNNTGWNKFFYEYMGVNVKIVNIKDNQDILETEEYKNMEVYPSNNSIKVINNTVVIKLE